MYESAVVFSGKHLKIIKGAALAVLPASPSLLPRDSRISRSMFWGELAETTCEKSACLMERVILVVILPAEFQLSEPTSGL